MSGLKNLILMGGAMMAVRRLDQEDPEVILMTRLFFSMYILITCVVNLRLYMKVIEADDKRTLIVPPPPPSPFQPPKPPSDDDDDDDDEGEDNTRKDVITNVLAYDLQTLASGRKSWLANAVILTLIHAKTGAVNPLLMSSVMGLARLMEEPLVKIHLFGIPALGKLKRPFEPEKNPLLGLMQGMMPPPPGQDGDTGGGAGAGAGGAVGAAGRANGAAKELPGGMRRRTAADPVEVEELHDDGEGEDAEEDDRPTPIADDEDRDDDNDFEDDEDESETKKSK